MLILTLWLMAFHAVTVIGLGYEILYKSTLGRCYYYILSCSSLPSWLHCNKDKSKTHVSLHL